MRGWGLYIVVSIFNSAMQWSLNPDYDLLHILLLRNLAVLKDDSNDLSNNVIQHLCTKKIEQ
jgi:hypothetical protein